MRNKTIAAILALIVSLNAGCAENPAEPLPEPEVSPETEIAIPEPEPLPEPEPEPIVKTAEAVIGATGDVLMHYPVIQTGAVGDGTYNFDSMFTYFKPYAAGVDFAVANLETTLAGLDNCYPYQGYPRFNCPDGIVDSLQRAGFDMLLTANNHTFDTGEAGFNRTLCVVDGVGVERIGTNAALDEKKYTVQEINGIPVGMICYTYETEDGDPERKSLNGIPMKGDTGERINTFHYGRLEAFYAELEEQLDLMKADGALASILFIHWGNEYQTKENEIQQQMAQAICDLGADVIIGGHPHVVQPVALLESTTEPGHHTVCLYSMGNAVSNQRAERIPSAKGYTEDGVLFQVRFARYSDGTVMLEDVTLLPTWVNLTRSEESGKKAYEIIPLDREVEDWKSAFTLTDSELSQAENSYLRTVSVVGEGLDEVRQYLAAQPTPADEPKE